MHAMWFMSLADSFDDRTVLMPFSSNVQVRICVEVVYVEVVFDGVVFL